MEFTKVKLLLKSSTMFVHYFTIEMIIYNCSSGQDWAYNVHRSHLHVKCVLKTYVLWIQYIN